MRRLFYLIGEPGAGKSTLIARVTEPLIPHTKDFPFAHTYWSNDAANVIELGKRRPGGFGGTDSLSMSVQPKVLEWMQHRPADVFGEGDRLANGKFFTGVYALGWEVTIAHLDVPAELAAERRAKRAEELGTTAQNDQWVNGRRTKVLRLAEDWATVIIDGTSDEAVMLDAVRSQPMFRDVLSYRPPRYQKEPA